MVTLLPEQTEVKELLAVISGLGFTVMVNGMFADTHPEVLFLTVKLKS